MASRQPPGGCWRDPSPNNRHMSPSPLNTKTQEECTFPSLKAQKSKRTCALCSSDQRTSPHQTTDPKSRYVDEVFVYSRTIPRLLKRQTQLLLNLSSRLGGLCIRQTDGANGITTARRTLERSISQNQTHVTVRLDIDPYQCSFGLSLRGPHRKLILDPLKTVTYCGL